MEKLKVNGKAKSEWKSEKYGKAESETKSENGKAKSEK
jgi:hypothetical protein